MDRFPNIGDSGETLETEREIYESCAQKRSTRMPMCRTAWGGGGRSRVGAAPPEPAASAAERGGSRAAAAAERGQNRGLADAGRSVEPKSEAARRQRRGLALVAEGATGVTDRIRIPGLRELGHGAPNRAPTPVARAPRFRRNIQQASVSVARLLVFYSNACVCFPPPLSLYLPKCLEARAFRRHLHAWLISHDLGKYFKSLDNLGAKKVSDLAFVTAEDLQDLGLTPAECARLQVRVG